MGQKINPVGFRLSVLKNWSSRWYANTRNFPAMLNEDIKVRDFLKKRLSHAAVSRIIIERHTFIDVNSLLHWELDGEGAWGEDQDMWPVHTFAARQRARRTAGGDL